MSKKSMLGAGLCRWALFALVAVAAQAQAETLLERVKAGGEIRIGFAVAPPFAFRTPDGVLSGHDPELVKAVLAKIGTPKVDSVVTEFAALIAGVKAQRLDVIASGLYINPKRCEEIAFSEPLFKLGGAMLVKQGNPKKIKDYGSFLSDKSLKMAIVAGSVDVANARAVGIEDGQLLQVRDNTSVLAAVQAGRADGGPMPAVQAASFVQRSTGVEATPQYFEIGGKSVAGYGGIGFRKEDKELLEEFNRQLRTYLGSPEYLAMAKQFGFGKDTAPDKTTAELCAAK